MANFSDTICAPATSVGTGAVSLIRISGPESSAVVDRVVCFRSGTAAQAPGFSLKFGTVEGLDEVLVALFRAPHSYTGEDAAEISCHASPFIVSSLLDRLTEAGCRLAEPGEFTRRAFVNGKMDLAQAESVVDVIASSTAAQHRVAMHQLRGGYSAELRALRKQLLELTALMELELDFSEEDVEFADRSRLRALLDTACSHCRQLADSFRLGNAIRNGVLSVPGVSDCAVLENTGDAADDRGIPAHSICVLFQGGNANQVAQTVFDKKAPGIGTYGALALTATDHWGGEHTVNVQRIANAAVSLTLELTPLAGYDAATVPAAIRAALAAFSSSFSVGQPLVLSSLYPVIYSAVSSSSPLFSIRMLTATFGGTTTSDTVNVAWNQKVLIRANQITITESTS